MLLTRTLRTSRTFLPCLLVFSLLFSQASAAFAQDGTHTIFLPAIQNSSSSDAPADDTPTDDTIDRTIPGQYIVVFQSDENGDPSVRGEQLRTASINALSIVSQYGGEILYTYEYTIHGFAAKMPAEAVTTLQQDPNIAYIEPDTMVEISDEITIVQNPATWGLDRIDQRDLPLNNTYTYNATGAGVNAYIIDTGVRASHTEFTGRMGNGFTSINDGKGTEDCNGHGSHVAGTVAGSTYGVAKAATIHAVRVLACNGSGSNSGVIAGVDWVTANHVKPAVANMSLGGSASTALDNAVKRSITAGVSYALAAGNENADACNSSPARVPEALTIGASTAADRRASFSNRGTCVDLFAPGENITSVGISSDGATASLSGTSMASPHVAGVIALYLEQFPSALPAQVNTALINNTTPNKLTSIGTGSPNRLLFMGFISATPQPTATATATASATETATAIPPTATATALPPTATATPIPPTPTFTATATNTPEPTNTSAPGDTPTAIQTPTQVPPSATATVTSVPPTATATPLPSATATVPAPTATPTTAPVACTDVVVNGTFESGRSAWSQSSRFGFDLICNDTLCGDTLAPHSGANLTWLGGANQERAEVRQTVSIPAGKPAKLVYWYQVESDDSCGYDKGFVRLTSGSTTTTLQGYDLCKSKVTPGWQKAQIDISQYAGKQVAISFRAEADYWLPSSLYIDDVALVSGTSCNQ